MDLHAQILQDIRDGTDASSYDDGWLEESDSDWEVPKSVDNVSLFYWLVTCINLFAWITYRICVLIQLIIYRIVDC